MFPFHRSLAIASVLFSGHKCEYEMCIQKLQIYGSNLEYLILEEYLMHIDRSANKTFSICFIINFAGVELKLNSVVECLLLVAVVMSDVCILYDVGQFACYCSCRLIEIGL